jgi:hypothetical protein
VMELLKLKARKVKIRCNKILSNSLPLKHF